MLRPLVALALVIALSGCSASGGSGQNPEHRPAPGGEAAALPGAASKGPLFEGLGRFHRTVTTRSPEAQRYFDQGLLLVFAFNHEEAIRSFREAARLDPSCAMAFWGM